MKNTKISLTKNASNRIKTLIKKNAASADTYMLQIVIDSGGCSGFQYKFNIVNEIQNENDIKIEYDGVYVVIDHISMKFVENAIIDFHDDIMGHNFFIKQNDMSKTNCSCGASFNIAQ